MFKKLIIFTLLVLLPLSAFAGIGSWFGGGRDAVYTDYGQTYEPQQSAAQQKSWWASAWDAVSTWVNDKIFQPIGDLVDRVFYGRSVVNEHSIEGLGNLSGRIKLDKDGSVYSIGDKTELELDNNSLPLKASNNEEYRLGTFEYDKESESFVLKDNGRKANSTEKELGQLLRNTDSQTNTEWKDTLRSDYNSTAEQPERIVVLKLAESNDISADTSKLSAQYRAMEREGMILYAVMQNDKVLRGQRSIENNTKINWLVFDNQSNTINKAESFYLTPSERPLNPNERTHLTNQLNKAQEIRHNGDKMAAFKVEEQLVKQYGLNHVINQKEQQTIQEHGTLIHNKPAEWEKTTYTNAIGQSNTVYSVIQPNDGYPNFKEGVMKEVVASVSLVAHSEIYDKPFVEVSYSNTQIIEGYKIKSLTTRSFMKDMVYGNTACYGEMACSSLSSQSYNVVMEDRKYEKNS